MPDVKKIALAERTLAELQKRPLPPAPDQGLIKDYTLLAIEAESLPLLQELYSQYYSKADQEIKNWLLDIVAFNKFKRGVEFLIDVPVVEPIYALAKALQAGCCAHAKKLLDAGIDRSQRFKDKPLIIWAAEWGDLACVTLLTEGLNPEERAALINSFMSVPITYKDGQDETYEVTEERATLQYAAMNGHTDVVRYLIMQSASPQYFGDALCKAAQYGHLAVVQLILEYTKESPELEFKSVLNYQTADGSSPIILASQGGHTQLVAYLAFLGADLRLECTDGNTALSLACAVGHVEVVKILLSYQVPLKPFDMVQAIAGGSTDIVEQLIAYDPTIIHTEHHNSKPIHVAAAQGKTEIMQCLLDAKASAEERSKNGFSPLDWAANEEKVEAVKMLLQRIDVSIEDRNPDFHTPLFLAAHNGDPCVVEQLLLAGAQPRDWNWNNIKFLPTVMEASIKNKWAIIVLLANFGATLSEAESDSIFMSYFKFLFTTIITKVPKPSVTLIVTDAFLERIFTQFYDPDNKYASEKATLLSKIALQRTGKKRNQSFTFLDIQLMAKMVIKFLKSLSFSEAQQNLLRDIIEHQALKGLNIPLLQQIDANTILERFMAIQKLEEAINKDLVVWERVARNPYRKPLLNQIIDLLEKTSLSDAYDAQNLQGLVLILRQVAAHQLLTEDDKEFWQEVSKSTISKVIAARLLQIIASAPLLQTVVEEGVLGEVQDAPLLHQAEEKQLFSGLLDLLFMKIIAYNFNASDSGFLLDPSAQQCLQISSLLTLSQNAVLKGMYPTKSQRLSIFTPIHPQNRFDQTLLSIPIANIEEEFPVESALPGP